jgi:hypothetical protein
MVIFVPLTKLRSRGFGRDSCWWVLVVVWIVSVIMAAVVSYGSVEDQNTARDPELDTADAAPVTDFDAAYYLKDTQPFWNARRLGNLLVPLLVAALIMGGAAAFLLRDFGTLYPGSGSGGSDTSRAIKPSDFTSSSSSASDTTSTSDQKSSSSSSSGTSSSSRHHSKEFMPPNDAGADCNVHPDCSMLLGKCCPTLDGEKLDCCSF